MIQGEGNSWSKSLLLTLAAGVATAGIYYAFTKAVQYRKIQDVEELLADFRKDVATPTRLLKQISEAMTQEMNAGLVNGGGSRLKMLPSFVDKLPTGDERGVYYALDLGGTNFRVLRVLLGGGSKRIVKQEYEEVAIPPSLMVSTTEELFDFIAKNLADFVAKEGPEFKTSPGQERELGFTFSFPVEQTAINAGTLIRWTKGFKIDETVGKDVVKVLEEAIARQSLNLKVLALVNDTVGTLAGARYWQGETMVAVILGTGTNACYVEKTESIGKWTGPPTDNGDMVINMEWGNFDSPNLPLTFADKDVDKESTNPGEQIYEKLISGMYLGDIARRILLKFAQETQFFGTEIPAKLEIKGSLPTPKLSKIDGDHTPNLQVVGEILNECLGITKTTLRQRKVVHDVCEALAERGARLAAAGVVGVLKKIGRDGSDVSAGTLTHLRKYKTSVAVDGGLYEHYPKFRHHMHEAVDELLGDNATGLITIELSNDGSGIGAALLAASHSLNSS